jgi:hypothetical protein
MSNSAGVTRRFTSEDGEAIKNDLDIEKAKAAAMCAEIEEMSAERENLEKRLSVAANYAKAWLIDERESADNCLSESHHIDVLSLFKAVNS